MAINVRTKIMVPISVILTIFLIIMAYYNYKNICSMQFEQEKVEYELIAQRINSDLENIFDQARLGLEAVVQNPGIQQAFGERDREKLQQLTMPIFESVNQEGIEQFQFHLAPAISFLRLHMPDKFGDDLAEFRKTVLESNQTKQLVQGLEEGRGGFGFRVVMPVFYQGQHVGSAEFGPGLNASLLEMWQEQMGGDYYIYSKGQSGVSWVDNEEGLLVATAAEDNYTISDEVIDDILMAGRPAIKYTSSSERAAIIVPLHDYSDKPIGYVKVVNDRTQILKQLNADLRNAIIQSVLAILIISGSVFLITTIITRPLTSLSRASATVARGDFTQTQSLEVIKSRDEVGILAAGFGKMVDSLRNIATGIKKHADRLASYSQELTASVEEVSATVEEVSGTTTQVATASYQVAGNAEKTAEEFKKMQQLASEGNRAVGKTVEKVHYIAEATENVSTAIQKLGEQSGQIELIINTITNIADMTNLLALNAAIEAARAGEHGRGFAVVAEEVRMLAEQSAGAADEVTSLVKDIQAGVGQAISAMERGSMEVSEGVQIANHAGTYLQQIISAVEESSAMIRDIADAAKEASGGTEQIAAASQEIASIMQGVSGDVLELTGLAGELYSTVNRLKVDD